MTILNKTVQTVKEFEGAMMAANKEFEAAKNQILETYKDPVSVRKLAEAREILTEIEMRETKIARELVVEDFAATRNAVEEYVFRSAPADFPATLAVIQAKGEDLTDYEASCFLKKYKDNYMAFSAILGVLNQSGKMGEVHIMKPDHLDEKITMWEKKVLNWIQTRNSASAESEYMSRLLTSEKETGNPIQILAAEVESFLNGAFILDNTETAKKARAAI